MENGGSSVDDCIHQNASCLEALHIQQLLFLHRIQFLIDFSIVNYFTLPKKTKALFDFFELGDAEPPSAVQLIERCEKLSPKIASFLAQLDALIYRPPKMDFFEKCSSSSKEMQPPPDGIPLKKWHEIQRFASFLQKAFSSATFKECCIFDVGCGQGYLACHLHEKQFKRIAGIDIDAAAVHSAKERAAKCAPTVDFYTGCFPDCFESVCSDRQHSFVCISLHGCGDLAGLMMRHSMNNANSRALCFVPCCYNRLCTQPTFMHRPAHPEVQRILAAAAAAAESGGCLQENRNVGMLACQNPATWIRTLQAQTQTRLSHKSLVFRATWQALSHAFRSKVPSLAEERRIGKVNVRRFVSFTQYASFLLIGKFGLCAARDAEPFSTLNNAESIDVNWAHWEALATANYAKIVFCWTVRASVGPLVESAINLNRLLWLKQQTGVEAHMFRIFDEHISPRNYCILALKESSAYDEYFASKSSKSCESEALLPSWSSSLSNAEP